MDASDAGRRLSALGASKGGVARAKKLSAGERSKIARKAALARWGGHVKGRRRVKRASSAVAAPTAADLNASYERITGPCEACARRGSEVRRWLEEIMALNEPSTWARVKGWGGFRAKLAALDEK